MLNFQDVKQFPFHLARVTANNVMAPKKPQVMTGRKRGRVVVKKEVCCLLSELQNSVRRNSGASRNPTRNFGTSRKSDLPRSKDFSYRRRRRVCLVDAILFNGRFAPLYIVLDHRTTQEVDGDDSPPSKRTRRRSGAVKQEVPDDDARGSRDKPKDHLTKKHHMDPEGRIDATSTAITSSDNVSSTPNMWEPNNFQSLQCGHARVLSRIEDLGLAPEPASPGKSSKQTAINIKTWIIGE
jgi:hypothetical protein